MITSYKKDIFRLALAMVGVGIIPAEKNNWIERVLTLAVVILVLILSFLLDPNDVRNRNRVLNPRFKVKTDPTPIKFFAPDSDEEVEEISFFDFIKENPAPNSSETPEQN